MGNDILIIGGLIGALLLFGNKKTTATVAATEKTPVKTITPVSTPAASNPVASKPVVPNPATGPTPTWTNNPTPGEVKLQQDLAAATAAGENLAPALVSAYGPAWNLMVITPTQWQSKLNEGWTESQLKAAYTTSEADRTAAIRDYWVAAHPGEEVPDILKDTNIVKGTPPEVVDTIKVPAAVTPVAAVVPTPSILTGIPTWFFSNFYNGSYRDINPSSPTYNKISFAPFLEYGNYNAPLLKDDGVGNLIDVNPASATYNLVGTMTLALDASIVYPTTVGQSEAAWAQAVTNVIEYAIATGDANAITAIANNQGYT
jgi:hypothetical protein